MRVFPYAPAKFKRECKYGLETFVQLVHIYASYAQIVKNVRIAYTNLLFFAYASTQIFYGDDTECTSKNDQAFFLGISTVIMVSSYRYSIEDLNVVLFKICSISYQKGPIQFQGISKYWSSADVKLFLKAYGLCCKNNSS